MSWPQQRTDCVCSSKQVAFQPALTSVTGPRPAGTTVSATPLSDPQHVTVASVLSAHSWTPLPEIFVTPVKPAGTLWMPYEGLPQQRMAPVGLRPQPTDSPA